MRKFLSSIALLIGFLGMPVQAQTQEYIRFVNDDLARESHLQVAVESFTRNGVTVDLYGVVHMADREYYHSVQADLDLYDAVLYEGIRQGIRPNPETAALNFVQKTMATVLGLDFQKDGIAYVGSNMIHADIDAGTLERSLDGQQLTPLGQMFSPEQIERLKPVFEAFGQLVGPIMDEFLARNPEMQGELKGQFAQQLANTDISQQLSPQMKKAIIDDRNEIVMGVLAQQLQDDTKRRIAIFYGAGHNSDFAQRLIAQGWTRGDKVWKTAWRISGIR